MEYITAIYPSPLSYAAFSQSSENPPTNNKQEKGGGISLISLIKSIWLLSAFTMAQGTHFECQKPRGSYSRSCGILTSSLHHSDNQPADLFCNYTISCAKANKYEAIVQNLTLNNADLDQHHLINYNGTLYVCMGKESTCPTWDQLIWKKHSKKSIKEV